MKSNFIVGAAVLAAGLAGCGKMPASNTVASEATPAAAAAAAEPAVTALVALQPTKGSKVSGTLTLMFEQGVVTLSGQVAGLNPNAKHGFHIHQKGDCSAPDASSAGDHFNPDGAMHGDPTSAVHHLGDMVNIQADETGTSQVNVKLAGVTLKDGGPNDLKGKSVIIHADPDDYTSQPAGNSGGRAACGRIA